MQSIQVTEAGAILTFTDSGIPSLSSELYTTVFAIHGLGFNARMFSKFAVRYSLTHLVW